MKIFRGACILILVCTFVSCDAPRINPLDPESSAYKAPKIMGTIEGTVRTQSAQIPLEAVKVSWKYLGVITTVLTNSNGSFSISGLEKNDGWIYFEKDGYSKDSSLVQFSNSNIIQIDKSLNANPHMGVFNLYTSVENYFPAIQSYTLFATTSVSDDEGDIDSVMIQNRSINFYKKLVYNSSSKLYQNSFQSSDLNYRSIIETQGTNFEIVAIDRNKKKFVLGSSSLTRVITQEVSLTSPNNNNSISSQPPYIFEWQRFLPFFIFEFMLEVYKIEDDLTETPKWNKSGISSNDVTDRCLIKLPSGNYYWVIWVVDSFGNRSRSKPATFVIP